MNFNQLDTCSAIKIRNSSKPCPPVFQSRRFVISSLCASLGLHLGIVPRFIDGEYCTDLQGFSAAVETWGDSAPGHGW